MGAWTAAWMVLAVAILAGCNDGVPSSGALPSARVLPYFDVPEGSATGASELEVVANGIASKPVKITVHPTAERQDYSSRVRC